MPPCDNSAHLRAWRERRSADAAARVRDVLDDVARQGSRISFAEVAREAEVSRSWLYESKFADEIRSSRDRPVGAGKRSEPASTESIRARLQDVLDENRRLRDELADVRRQLALALGERRSGAF